MLFMALNSMSSFPLVCGWPQHAIHGQTQKRMLSPHINNKKSHKENKIKPQRKLKKKLIHLTEVITIVEIESTSTHEN